MLHLVATFQVPGSEKDCIDQLIAFVQFKVQHVLSARSLELGFIEVVEKGYALLAFGQIDTFTPIPATKEIIEVAFKVSMFPESVYVPAHERYIDFRFGIREDAPHRIHWRI